jgi:hypothetical protein
MGLLMDLGWPNKLRTPWQNVSSGEKCRADLLYSCPGFSQLFFSFLTFLLLFAQYGGAIDNSGTLTVKYGNFTGNSADEVRILAPIASALNLLYSCPGFSQLFFSFLTFLLLLAQLGGAIYNAGTLAVKYGNFTGNSANAVCIIAPHSQCPRHKILSPSLLYSCPGTRVVLEKLELSH